jgi:putative hydrolase of the HAD superfamily
MSTVADQIRVVFFDIGGVLIEIHPDRTMSYWAEVVGIPPDVIEKHFPEEAFHAYERGEITGSEFFTVFKQTAPELNAIQEADFWEGWKRLLGEENGSVMVLKQLSHRYPVWLLSNTNPQHIQDELGLRVSFLNYITGAIYSFDAGCRKPDPEIFEYALNKVAVEASQAIFIDDIPDNVNAAREMGMHAIHFTDSNRLVQDLNRMGFHMELLSGGHGHE